MLDDLEFRRRAQLRFLRAAARRAYKIIHDRRHQRMRAFGLPRYERSAANRALYAEFLILLQSDNLLAMWEVWRAWRREAPEVALLEKGEAPEIALLAGDDQ